MTQRIILLIIYLASCVKVCGQCIEPLDLAKRIFSKNYFMDNSGYITGEYTGQPNGFDIGKNSTTKFRILHQNLKESVINMTILDSNSKGVDTYLYFTKDSVWKMYAFRALAMTGWYEQMKYELEAHPYDKSHSSKFKTKEEYELALGNVNLTLELDDNIIAHFEKNKTEFERLKGLALLQFDQENDSSRARVNLIEVHEPEYRKLYISSVSKGEYELSNCISFRIGGMVDNTVGYLYVSDKKNLPKISPKNVIMLREIGNGWYIYKTT